MEKDTLLNYGKFIGAIIMGAAVVYTALVDRQMASDPAARPKSFSSDDWQAGKADLLRYIDSKFHEAHDDIAGCRSEIQRQLDDVRTNDKAAEIWRNEHDRFASDQLLLNQKRWGDVEVRLRLLEARQ